MVSIIIVQSCSLVDKLLNGLGVNMQLYTKPVRSSQRISRRKEDSHTEYKLRVFDIRIVLIIERQGNERYEGTD